ncbi:MAG: glycosyltransferase family 39 protein [Nanoarchaeota archaeon]|nr:glycosyltransferase family 39 protein [Nanoarchaeota archaeon]
MREQKRVFLKNIFLILIFIGLFLRLYNLGTSALYTDEAEVFLAATNIKDFGIPKGFFRVQFYENSYIEKSNNSMYEFKPTNYLNTNTVIMKGWFPYYITFIASIFGRSEFILRFPFALIGVLSLLMIYLLTKLLFNEKTALIALFLQATSPSMLFYDRMIRYYSPMILLILATAYFFIKAFKDDKNKDYVLGTIVMILLFYTHIIACFSIGVILLIFRLLTKKDINKKSIVSVVILIIIVIPWIFGVGFFQNMANQPRLMNVWNNTSKNFLFQSVIAGIANQGMLNIFLYLALLVLVINLFVHVKNSKNPFVWNKDSVKFLFLYLIVFLIIPSILVPFSSFEEKLFLPLIPISLVLIATLFESIICLCKNRTGKVAIIIILFVLSFVHVDSVFGRTGHNNLTISKIMKKSSDTFITSIDFFLKNYDISNETLILTTGNQFPMMYYIENPVQIVWPVRKDFINNYRGELIIVEKEPVDGTCNHFYQYVNSMLWCENNKNYLEKIKSCKEYSLDSQTTLYYCEKEDDFISGGFGLFFSDFVKNSPPDFVWDGIPFLVAIDIENFGEYTIPSNMTKIVFTDSFASDFFDSNKEEMLVPERIEGLKIVDGIVVRSKVRINLGNVSYNKKMINKFNYFNASVKLCYPYTTILRVDICNDDLAICDYDFSAGPIKIDNFGVENISFIFQLANSAEGKLGSTNECKADNATKIIKVVNDVFECSSDKTSFECKGVKSRIIRGNSYYLNISYDYQQEFKKYVMMKNRDYYQNDFEEYKKQQV